MNIPDDRIEDDPPNLIEDDEPNLVEEDDDDDEPSLLEDEKLSVETRKRKSSSVDDDVQAKAFVMKKIRDEKPFASEIDIMGDVFDHQNHGSEMVSTILALAELQKQVEKLKDDLVAHEQRRLADLVAFEQRRLADLAAFEQRRLADLAAFEQGLEGKIFGIMRKVFGLSPSDLWEQSSSDLWEQSSTSGPSSSSVTPDSGLIPHNPDVGKKEDQSDEDEEED